MFLTPPPPFGNTSCHEDYCSRRSPEVRELRARVDPAQGEGAEPGAPLSGLRQGGGAVRTLSYFLGALVMLIEMALFGLLAALLGA